MERFAFILHPLGREDFLRKFPWLRFLPQRAVEEIFGRVPPFQVAHITGIRSRTGREAEGWFIVLPMTPRLLLSWEYDRILPRLEAAGHLAEGLGAKIVGLGAFTKVVGDRGLTLSRRLSIPVTTGNSYTAASAVEGAFLGLKRLGKDPGSIRAAVVGATGSIGTAVSGLLADRVGELVLVARDGVRLEALRSSLPGTVTTDQDVKRAVAAADLVLTVSSAPGTLIEAEDLRPGAVVCDVARPRNVSAAVARQRDDVLVMDGGVIRVPGTVDFGFDFGFPPGTAEACIAETIMLALDERYESFTLGPTVEPDKVRLTQRMAEVHGFEVAGFRRFEKALSEEEIDRVMRNAQSG